MPGHSTEVDTATRDAADEVATWLVRHSRALIWTMVAVLMAWHAYLLAEMLAHHRAGYVGASFRPPATEEQVLGRGRHPDAGRLVVVHPGSPAEAAGLRVGDELVAVDGIPASDAEALEARGRHARRGDAVRVTVRPREPAGAPERDVVVVVASPYATPRQQAVAAIRWVVAIGVFFGTGLFLAIKRLQDPRALLFFVFSTLAAVTLSVAPLFESRLMPSPGQVMLLGPRVPVPWLALAGMTAAAFVSSSVLLHFALLFPRPAHARPLLDRVVRLVYLILPTALAGAVPLAALLALGRLVPRPLRPLALVVLAAVAAGAGVLLLRRAVAEAWREGRWQVLADRPAALIGALTLGSAAITFSSAAALLTLDASPHVSGMVLGGIALAPAAVTFVVGVLVYPLAVCIVLWRNYRRGTAEERLQVKWPVWGTSIANVGALLLSAVAIVAAFRTPGGAHPAIGTGLELLTWAFYSLIPLSFAFAILRYRLLDIDVLIRRTVIYAAVSAGVLGVYLLAVVVVSRIVATRFAQGDTLAVILSTLAAAAAFVPLRAAVQRFVDARFFRTRAATARALGTLGRELAAADSVAALGARAVQALVAATPVRSAALLALADGEPTMRVAGAHGVSEPVREAVERCGAMALLARLPSGPVPSEGLDVPAEWRAALDALRARCVVALREGEEVRGVLVLGPKLSEDDYDDDDRELLAAAASQIALAWRSVRARGQDAELREALEIQRSLLPAVLPRTPGFTIAGAWQPAKVVGGDYYDAWLVGPSRCALCIADVSGKGLPASLLMANLQATMRALAKDGVEADVICTSVNRAVSAHIRPGRFITCFLGMLDLTTGHLDYVNAGHNPPLLARSDGTMEWCSTGGIGLGMLAGYEYRAKATTLAPGDRLLLYTDGVTDARDAAGEDFGDQRLAHSVETAGEASAEHLQLRLLDAVRAFSGNRFDDDVTVLAVVRDRG